MHAHRQRYNLTDDHELRMAIPRDFPTGAVEVIVLSDESADANQEWIRAQQTRDLNVFFDLLKALPPSGLSIEEINRQVREERDSWE